MLRKYTDLSDFVITFDPLKHKDNRWKQIFEDEFARVIFVGYRLHHLVIEGELNILMEEALLIGNEMRKRELTLEHKLLKNRLKVMYNKVHGIAPNLLSQDAANNDINDYFVEYLLTYLKGEKSFGYTIKQK